MSNLTPRVFVSTTTQDLASCRAAVKEELLTAGILPVTQENFGPDYRSLSAFIEHEISKSDAVICIVGHLFGASPEEQDSTPRSFAQLEYDFAVHHNKPVFVFLTDKDFIPDNPVIEDGRETELQQQHRNAVMSAGHKWENFSDINDLRLKIAHAVRKIPLRSEQPVMRYLHSPRKPSYFTGRICEIDQLSAALFRKVPTVIAVIGMGGQGKTTLVHKFLVDLQTFPFKKGFWCTAYRGSFTFDMFLDESLSFLLDGKFDKRNMPDTNARSTHLLGFLQQQPVLLVIDGIERWLWGWNSGAFDPQRVENTHERTAFHPGLDEFLQAVSGLTNGTHLILTSRALPAVLDQVERAHIPVRDENNENLGLEGLDPVASVDLLQKLGVSGTNEELKIVAESFVNHPLALTVLGTLLRKKYGGRLDRLPRIPVMDPRYELQRLFDDIRVNLPGRDDAERFLRVASHCIENPSIRTVAAGMFSQEMCDDEILDNLVEEAVMLADWSLLWWNGVTETVSLHPLVKDYFCSLSDEAESNKIHENLSFWYGSQEVDKCAATLEHLRPRILAIKHAAHSKDLDRAADLMFTQITERQSLFAWFSKWGHQFSAVEILGELAEVAGERLRGYFLLAQAQMYQDLARPQLAIDSLVEAIEIFGRLGNSSSAESLSNLAKAYATRGNIHRETGRSASAIPDFDKAIEILEKLGDAGVDVKLDLAKTFANRGSAYRGIGALSRSIHEYDDAYKLWKNLIASNPHLDDSALAPILTNRGIVFLEMRAVYKAINDLDKAVEICSGVEESENPEMSRHLAHAKSMLGIAYMYLGQHEKATKCSNEAVMILQDAVDKGRQDFEHFLALALINRADVYMGIGQWTDALLDCDRSNHIYQRLVSEAGSHFRVSLSRTHIERAIVKYELGDFDGSEADRSIGFKALRELMDEWSDESEILIEFLRDALKTVKYLLPSYREEGYMILNEVLTEFERVFHEENSTEALCNELIYSVPKLEDLMPKLKTAEYGVTRVRELIEWTKLTERV